MKDRDNPDKPARIFAVIVLYKKTIEDCVTLQTLLTAMREVSSDALFLKVLLFDNTPQAISPTELPGNVQYKAASKNGGLSGAYNFALSIAESEGYDWLITLDQDSHLPQNYLSRMTEAAQSFASNTSVAAVVPQLADRGLQLSPYTHGFLRASAIPSKFVGFIPRELHAYNSAAMLRVSILIELGGFSYLFWLDALDEWLYSQFFRINKRVFVDGEIQIEHELSILDVKNRVNYPRYQNFLHAEAAYIDMYRGFSASWVHNLRLVVRWVRNRRAGVDISLQNLLLDCLKDRLLHPKKQRIAKWTNDMEKFNAELYAPPDR
ncbi:glycosyltransferase [Silvibacterium dinghuense]|uniref:Glycosyltransferase n=1 Tax=Silvibacterium dinghuense TaxID=1560006 RepID=A0A4Q1SF60_9BACT|nr:glycosyltransferase [Silvibacterium dinghuense]RXS95691.1 glycosyltransferase [Silvibacterium dinghuense]GGH14959.1 hypothetical protein GCM10011586_35750 [Silvibacterium dinghuense]